MRNLWAFGLISLVTAAAFVACGDDDNGSTPGTAGTGGSAGAGGGAGAAGMAGSSSMAGTGGSGTAGSAGSGSTPMPPAANCTGCVQVTVPIPATALDTTNNRSQAQANFTAAMTSPPYDLTNVTRITWRVQALTNSANFYVSPYVQNSPPESDNTYPGVFTNPTTLTAAAFPPGTWVDVSIDIPTPGADAGADGGADSGVADAGLVADAGDAGAPLLTTYDKSKTRVIGLAVGGTSAAAGEQVSIEIDSVTVVGTSNFTTQTFDSGAGGLALNTFYQFPPGSTLTTH